MRPLQREFKTADEALSHICFELLCDGDQVQIINSLGDSVNTIELLDYSVTFAPKHGQIINSEARKFPKKGASAEFLWYMSGNCDTDIVAKYLPNWSKFTNIGTLAASNYGYYWHKYTKSHIIDELTRDKNSRRAILHIYDSNARDTYRRDTPCTSSIQFFIRNNALSMRVTMRSNDLWYGFGIDQYCFSLYHQLVYNELKQYYPDLTIGFYKHNANSMHIYENVVDRDLLATTFRDVAVSDRIELPETLTISNFWQDLELLNTIFDSNIVKHFYDNIACFKFNKFCLTK
jgi:thymidylate synthase